MAQVPLKCQQASKGVVEVTKPTILGVYFELSRIPRPQMLNYLARKEIKACTRLHTGLWDRRKRVKAQKSGHY